MSSVRKQNRGGRRACREGAEDCSEGHEAEPRRARKDCGGNQEAGPRRTQSELRGRREVGEGEQESNPIRFPQRRSATSAVSLSCRPRGSWNAERTERAQSSREGRARATRSSFSLYLRGESSVPLCTPCALCALCALCGELFRRRCPYVATPRPTFSRTSRIVSTAVSEARSAPRARISSMSPEAANLARRS
jgi:hypothetical protein